MISHRIIHLQFIDAALSLYQRVDRSGTRRLNSGKPRITVSCDEHANEGNKEFSGWN